MVAMGAAPVLTGLVLLLLPLLLLLLLAHVPALAGLRPACRMVARPRAQSPRLVPVVRRLVALARPPYRGGQHFRVVLLEGNHLPRGGVAGGVVVFRPSFR